MRKPGREKSIGRNYLPKSPAFEKNLGILGNLSDGLVSRKHSKRGERQKTPSAQQLDGPGPYEP